MGFLKGLTSRFGSGGHKVEEEVTEEAHLPRLSLDDTLGNPDPEVRLHAVSSIAEIGPAAVPLLITALHDESWRVRRGAATGLIRILEPAIDPLINNFEGARTDVRMEITRALTLIGDRAFPALVSALEDPSPEIRSGVVAAIGMMEGQKRFDPLERALKDNDPDVRTAAALAFGYLPDDKAIPTLLILLGDDVESVRDAAIDACTRLGVAAIAPLINALEEVNLDIRARIEEIIVRIGSLARTDLIELLQHQEPMMRRSAVRMLGKIKDPNTVSHLIGTLADPDLEVRTAAVIALTGIGKAALPEITAAFENDDVRIREGAMQILAGIGEPAVASLIVYLKNDDPAIRRRATVILGEIGSHEAHEPLTDLIRDDDPAVRREAFEALERIR